MNPDFKNYKDFLHASDSLSKKEKARLLTFLEGTEIELLQKASTIDSLKREVEFEAAMERVRTRTMAMRSTADIADVVLEFFHQLNNLEVPFEQAWITILHLDKGYFDTWFSPIEGIYTEPVHFKMPSSAFEDTSIKAWKSGDLFSYLSLTSKTEVDQFLKACDQLTDSTYFTDAQKKRKNKRLEFVEARHAYGFVSKTTTEKPTREDELILQRVAKVFEQTYTRFLDLQKAEAQAREAQIEAALEKVRSRSLAMQKSQELSEVIQVVYEQMAQLDILVEHAGFIIDYRERDDMYIWLADKNGAPSQVTSPYFDSIFWNRFNEAKEKRADFLVVNLSFEEKNAHYRELFKHIPELTEESKEFYFNCKGLGTSTVLLENVALYIENFSGIPYSDQENEILRRFGKVFQQTYTRFLDLQKSEAQTREARIEAALEKVRSQSMAMQSSTDLSKVTTELFDQLRQFKADLFATGIVFCDKHEGHVEQWHSIPNAGMMRPFIVPIDLDYIHQYRYDQWKKGTDLFSIEIPSDFIQEHFKSIFELPSAQVVLKEFEANNTPMPGAPDWEIDYGASFKNGYLLVSSLQPFAEAQILPRFAQVFEQAYTRFLDLQKAESQAREAQIETALERVRAASMAMHSSSELYNVINIMSEQLNRLDIEMDAAMINEKVEGSKDWYMWLAIPSLSKDVYTRREKVHVPYIRSAAFDRVYSSEKEGKSVFSDQLTKPQKDLIFRHYFKNSNHRDVPKARQDYILSSPGLSRTTVLSKNSFIQFYRYSHQTFSEGQNQILERIGKVFEQSYTRFLDLKKAEEQARQAQIGAALERVRARTMAMHKSEELSEVAAVLFEQIEILGVAPERLNIGIIQEEEGLIEFWSTKQGGQQIDKLFKGSIEEPTTLSKMYSAWKAGRKSLEIEQTGEELKRWIHHLQKVIGLPFDKSLKRDRRVHSAVFFTHGMLLVSTPEPIPKESIELLSRFSKVFEQTYTRFLDLQKAEAQAREAEIQLSLERVRARSMAMHNSDELNDVLSVFFQQFDVLDIKPVSVFLSLFDLDKNTFTYRSTGRDGSRMSTQQVVDMDTLQVWKDLAEKWKKDKRDSIEVIYYPKEILPDLFALLDETFSAMPEEERITAGLFPDGGYAVHGYCNFGYIGYNHTRKPTEEEQQITIRFATEFGRLYQRFLDIEKAEAQARESEIEAALERVRSKTMAMHNSDDVGDTVVTLFQEVTKLGLDNTIRCGIGILQDNQMMETWSANSDEKGEINLKMGMLNMSGHPMLKGLIKAWENGENGYSYHFIGEDVTAYYTTLNNEPEYPFEVDLSTLPDNHFTNVFFFAEVVLFAFTHNPLSEAAKKVLERFASVFGQTYRRYLDLIKAEEQARESQIEAALERVRAKTMAMHNTDDIADTVVTFFEELVGLGLDDTMRAGIGIISQSEQMKVWTASVPETSKTILHSGFLDMSLHPLLHGVKSSWTKGDPQFTYLLKGKDLKDYFSKLNEAKEYPVEFDLEKLPESVTHLSIPFKDGTLFTFTKSPLPEDIVKTLERFAAVFGQTYTRYLDLQKAEERARESRIEAALERVRAKALAMHSSEDLRQTITAVFQELKNLDVKTIRLGLGLVNPDEPEGEIVTSRIGDNGDIIEVNGNFRLEGHPILDGIYVHFKKQEDYFPILQGEEITSYYESVQKSVDVQGLGTSSSHYGCFLYFPEGCLYAWAGEPHSEAQIEILKKFCRVVEITYRRYNDLIESEAREKEAVKQASLDRVRAEIASMRTTKDLERITPLVWKELTTLGIPFFRCGVFIMDEASQMVHVYLTTPEGDALGAMDLPFDFEVSFIHKGVEHWRKQKAFIEEWDQKQFIELTTKLMQHGQVKNIKTYQAGEKPPKRLVLHQVPFAQGMLYVGSTQTLSEVEMDIVKALTRTFAVAYARYEDFNQLEKTLAELKATQDQLIQSEKMASLGELTAGIAHEIKNPLNFVNNFSEVSRELLQELLEELKKGDIEEVNALAEDVVQNLEKIVHHGQRADGIVKGMLQHSRSGDGKKEAADLNELADEYLRLAYHGLRAKDKSFNATMHTEFEPSLGKVNIIPQEMGRVILNLLTNAFYAVSERKKKEPDSYQPTVWVKTRKSSDGIEVSVRDNGGGIPDAVREKIFQPFFTTKPTGSGTGLGLSMSYDIVTKGHGGELSARSEEGVGTEFLIKLKVS